VGTSEQHLAHRGEVAHYWTKDYSFSFLRNQEEEKEWPIFFPTEGAGSQMIECDLFKGDA
jgi:hypothetical protein